MSNPFPWSFYEDRLVQVMVEENKEDCSNRSRIKKEKTSVL